MPTTTAAAAVPDDLSAGSIGLSRCLIYIMHTFLFIVYNVYFFVLYGWLSCYFWRTEDEYLSISVLMSSRKPSRTLFASSIYKPFTITVLPLLFGNYQIHVVKKLVFYDNFNA